ncbi:MAG TPA: GIY-YIG nuclease family protein [Candidatus Syntrophosphaera sp.]|nr:GIY-YIG nuclease family protein [Candidatus Syntrophosphaera sp.]HPH61729.1 GIY-YIG nuclease family protein [Candidatus Syntrophosphaera sp.]
MKQYFTYIVASKRNGTIYTGVTNDLARRMLEHKEGKIPGFTKKYVVNMLVWYEVFASRDDAIQAEKRIKKYRRVKKLEMIEKMNPMWQDLSDFSSKMYDLLPF